MQTASMTGSSSQHGRLSADRTELILRAEPVIADRVADLYRFATDHDDEADALSAQHRRLWRSMILDHQATMQVSRKALLQLGETYGLPSGFVEAVDQDVMEELLEIVLARYQASRAAAKRFSLVLMAAASSMGEARGAA